MDEIASIKSEIQLLTTRLAALENASKQETQSGGDPVAFGTDESSPIEIAKLRAFDVTCDGHENDPWLIYLPAGCISYAGFEPDEIDPAPGATTRLSNLGTAIKDGGIYAHLYLELDDDSDGDSSTEPKVIGFPLLSIDTTPTQTPSEENLKVINIKIATITDGAVSQNVSSALILGGGGSSSYTTTPPAPFDIEKVSTEPSGGGDPVESLSVINCKFNFNGESKTVADYSVPQGAAQVWLVGVETNGVWEWRLDTTPESETSQNGVFNLKLYDLDGLDVEMDYRTTFQTVTRGVFKLTGEEGATDGSNPEPLSGNVTISGKAKSGIKFKTTRNDGVKVDIKGRGENDNFQVREVKNSSDQVIAKIFGTAGFKICGGPDDIDVITGGELRISGNYLQVKWTKKKIKAVTVEDVTTAWENAMTLDEITVPTDLAYSESTVEFTQKPQTILVPHADPAQDDEVVFTATPHSEEATN